MYPYRYLSLLVFLQFSSQMILESLLLGGALPGYLFICRITSTNFQLSICRGSIFVRLECSQTNSTAAYDIHYIQHPPVARKNPFTLLKGPQSHYKLTWLSHAPTDWISHIASHSDWKGNIIHGGPAGCVSITGCSFLV